MASFPKPGAWTEKEEARLLAANLWSPSTLDFQAVAGTGSKVIVNTWDFLLKIVKTQGKISRLNFFSHANASIIAMQGELLADGSNVMLGTEADTQWTQIIAANGDAILDPFAAKWGKFGENGDSVVLNVDGTDITLKSVREKFTSDAVIYLYLCHGAADPMMFQEVANTFQVTAKAFKEEIIYCVPTGFPKTRKHKVNPKTTTVAADSCPTAVSDFHQLDTHASLRTATPKKHP